MKTMIVITGLTCSGKTYMAGKLKRKYKWESIHTDSFYAPLHHSKPKSQKVGLDSKEKREYFESRVPVGDMFIIEGSHAGNKEELELYKGYLSFRGDVIIFEAKSRPDNFKKWFAVKYREDLRKKEERLRDYWKSFFDIEVDQVVYSWREIDKFIKEHVRK